MSRRPSIVEVGLTALLVVLGGAAFGWVFGWRSAEVGFWLAVVVASVVPVLLGASLDRLGAGRPLVVVPAQLVAWAVVGTALVAVAGGAPADVAGGVVGAWGSLISFTLPAGGDPELLVVPITLCWLAGAVAAGLLTRTRSRFGPALVAGALLVAARLFGPGGPTPSRVGHLLLAGAIVVVGVLLAARRTATHPPPAGPASDLDTGELAVGEEPGDRSARAGWLHRAAPTAVVVTLAAVAVVASIPLARPAATLRDLHEPPPPDDVEVASPLDALTTDLSTAADEVVLRVAMTVGPTPDGTSMVGGAAPRLRLVTLDTYDGVEWSSAARYLRAGEELPAPVSGPATTVEVGQDVELVVADGPWLPAAAWPRSIDVGPMPSGSGAGSATEPAGGSGDDAPVVAFDAASGGLVLEGASAAGLTYHVDSAVPAVTAADLERATLPASADLAPAIALPPGMPAGLAAVADEAMGRAASPFQQLVTLEAWLRSNAQLDLDAPGGTSYGALTRFLAPGSGTPSTPVGPSAQGTTAPQAPRIGTPQQFATAFAVLARSRGLPARVAVGYRTEEAAAASGTTVDIRRGDIAVWPEAYLDGVGWVPFDPIPAAGSAPTPEQPQVDEVTQAKTDAIARTEQPDQSIPPASNPIIAAAEAERGASWVVVAAVVLAGLVLTAVVVVVGRPVRRRAQRRRLERDRRRAPAERDRVLGAWHHVVDALEAHGAGALDSATVPEVTARVRERWGPSLADQVAGLGTIVNDTVFDPDAVPVDGAAPATAGDRGAVAWRSADAIVAALRSATPRDPGVAADGPEPDRVPELVGGGR